MSFLGLCSRCRRALVLSSRNLTWSLWISRQRDHFLFENSRLSLVCINWRYFSASPPLCSEEHYSTETIRNFSIVAHVDHGKSTLADRLLEMTGVIEQSSSNRQVLDKLPVERQRGITVKAQTATMFTSLKDQSYMINLIDTPGHVDFSYEVSRSLAACQGVLLLVDAQQGVQVQTVANFLLAFEAGLTVIPVINKIDLSLANVPMVVEQLGNAFGFEESEMLRVSAKLGTGVEHLLPSIIEKVPSPSGARESPLRMLLFDSWYDHYRGVICLVAVTDGSVGVGDEICSSHTGLTYEVTELGILQMKQVPQQRLHCGQVGYLVMGMRSVHDSHIGDTFHHPNTTITPLPGFKPAKPMVYMYQPHPQALPNASILQAYILQAYNIEKPRKGLETRLQLFENGLYPMETSEYPAMRVAVEKLTLNDGSVSIHRDSSVALGQGWRLGFLGLLHMDVFRQRLEEEYNASVIVTSPSVPYKALLRTDEEVTILNPAQFPEGAREYYEPIVLGTLVFPAEYLGKIIKLCGDRRGIQKDLVFLDQSRVLLKYMLPLSEVVLDFYDQIKTISSGYASFDYEDHGYQPAPLVKLDILLNGNPVDALAVIVHKEKAYSTGKRICVKLKENIHRQLYEVSIQAAIGKKVIARETVKALRKNVTAKCYGGDITRKMKLLKKQKEGKKRLKQISSIELDKEAFLSVIER